MIADTPKPPYYAVIFSSINTENVMDYSEMAVITSIHKMLIFS